MNLEQDASYQRSMIISENDPIVRECPYSTGDIFILREDCIDDTWNEALIKFLEKEPVLQLSGLSLDIYGEVGYLLTPKNTSEPYIPNTLQWTVSPKELEEWFVYLGKAQQHYDRFTKIILEA